MSLRTPLPFFFLFFFLMLRFSRENGCTWDEWTCILAVCDGHFEVLQWALSNGAPLPISNYRFTTCAAGHNRLKILQWLIANGYPFDYYSCRGYAKGRLHLHWFIESAPTLVVGKSIEQKTVVQFQK